jgi:hypothetical protein
MAVTEAHPLVPGAGAEDGDKLDESSLAALISFFKLLDRWDREGKCSA